MLLKIKNISLLFAFLGMTIINLNGQDMFEATQLTFDDDPEAFPSWSPDGKFLIYSHIFIEDTLGKNGIWRITTDGKEATQIFSGIAEHPKWSPDGRYIVFDADTGSSIKMIPAEGGVPVNIIPDSIHILHGGLPCWSPDGSQIAFMEGTTLSVYVMHIKTGKIAKIFQSEDNIPLPACWSHDGKSVIVTLMEKGTHKSTVLQISSDGEEIKEISGLHEGIYRYIALSPDGTFMVYAAVEEGILGFWIRLAEGGKSLQFVSQPRFNESPCWSPDGKKIAFTSTRSGSFDVWVMDIDTEKVLKELQALNK